MNYWIFTRNDGTCLAIHEDSLGDIGISDELGELAYDDPMPEKLAQQHVNCQGGQIIKQRDPIPHHAAHQKVSVFAVQSLSI